MEVRGIRRAIDSVGRVSIPKEFRDVLNWGVGDDVEILMVDNGVLIQSINSKSADISVTITTEEGVHNVEFAEEDKND